MKAFNQIQFIKSASKIANLPEDSGYEVAFVGRSNAGKSSALNAITGVSIARTSKIPGRTQLINLFKLTDNVRLVDLPGYGYAKVPDSLKLAWQALMTEYLSDRNSLKGLILMMDIRHPLKTMDRQMIEWSVSCGLPVHILLTKADKISRSKAKETLMYVKKELGGVEDYVSMQIFSAFTAIGIEEVRFKILEWAEVGNPS